MVVLNAQDVKTVGNMARMMASMRLAFEADVNGLAIIPERIHLQLPDRAGVGLIMPAFVARLRDLPSTFATKFFSVMHGNVERGIPAFQGATVLLDSETGVCKAVIDAAALTALRTGASCGVATDLFSRPDSEVLAVFGAGPQAMSSLEAILTIRSIKRVYVLGRHATRIQRALSQIAPQVKLIVALPDEMVWAADIVLTATNATSPLFDASALRLGTHISALGSFQPGMQELPEEAVAKARVFVDNRAAARTCGDLTIPLEHGLIDDAHLVGLVGDVLTGVHPGRRSSDEITIYKSIGNAIQDAVAAQTVFLDSLRAGIGQSVEW